MKLLSRLLRLIYSDREYAREIQEVWESILKGVLYVCAVVGFPASVIGSTDAFRQGQWQFGITFIGLYLIIPVCIVLSRRINYNIRAFVPIIVHYMVSLSVLLRIGLSGVGSELLIACSVMAAMLYGLRFGLATMAAGAVTFAAVGTLMITGIIPLNRVAMLNSASVTSWITTIMVFIIETSILALSPIVFQKKLHESMKKYRHLITYAPAGICEIDIETGKFTFVNDVICEHLGYAPGELVGHSPLDILRGENTAIHRERLEKVKTGDEPTTQGEYQITARNGTVFDVVVYPRYTYRDGKVASAMYVIHDISERKKWERELMDSLKEKEILLKAIPCTLIINELIANAYEHAFPENRTGSISISLRESDGGHRLTVEDNGIGIPDEMHGGNTDSLGLKLIQALVQQLNGKMEFEKSGGTKCVITF